MANEQLESIYNLMLGCDPELFLERKGKIIGAEKVIPPNGLKAAKYSDYGDITGNNMHAFVLDGVQVELNPTPHRCRANLGNEMRAAFQALKAHLEKIGNDVKPSFKAVILVPKAEFDSLSDKSKALGCEPSFNKYDKGATVSVKNPDTYRKRSAGGHIHLGLNKRSNLYKERERLVELMDIIVGNTCVMIDRDPGAVERRKHYGRAGEYRLPNHGLEYRTLSNFWLRSYPLMSMVMGLSKIAVSVLNDTVKSEPDYVMSGEYGSPWNAEGELLKCVDVKAVREAINGNDLKLAKENFEGVQKFIRKHIHFGNGLNKSLLTNFNHFLDKIEKKGIEYWFSEDPMKHWCNMPDGHNHGWESFLHNKVNSDRLKAAKG